MNNVLDDSWVVSLDETETNEIIDNVLFLGDIALAHGVANCIEEFGYQYNFDKILDEFKNKSLVVFNLECCLTKRGNPWEPKPVLMNGKPEYLNIFPDNVRYSANLSNNHFLDLGVEGAIDTISNLKAKNIECFGAIDSDLDYFASSVTLKNTKLIMLAYSPVAHPFKENECINVSDKNICEMVKDVQLHKDKNGLLIVSLHQGVEFCRFTDKQSRQRAHALVNSGADAVICHHTHVIQGVEIYKGKPIFYGIGNFLIDIDTKKMPNTKYSLGLELIIQSKIIKKIKVTPYFIDENLQVQYLKGLDKNRLLHEINWLSLFFNKPLFSLLNYLFADLFWMKLHSSAALSLIKRVGFFGTFRYYLSRILAKINHK